MTFVLYRELSIQFLVEMLELFPILIASVHVMVKWVKPWPSILSKGNSAWGQAGRREVFGRDDMNCLYPWYHPLPWCLGPSDTRQDLP